MCLGKATPPALCTPADMMRTPQLCWVPQSYLQKTSLSGTERFTCASNVVKRPGIGAAECVQYLQEQGGVDAAFAVHMLSILPPGLINLQPSVRANGGITFHIDIQGKSGHGARPDVAVSAAEIMCDTYQQLLRIPSNHHEAAKTCVISPCVLHSGTRFNVIPGEAVIEGTIRFMGIEDGTILEERVRHVAEAVAVFHGGTAQVQFTPAARYPVVNERKNDRDRQRGSRGSWV